MSLFSVVGSKLKQVFKMQPLDWCELMKGDKQGSGMAKLVFDTFKDAFPEFIQPCPYSGHYQKFNAVVNKKYFSFLPPTTLRVFFGLLINDRLMTRPSIDLELFD